MDGVRACPAVERDRVGSTASLVAVGFTAVYREGFETALFYQSLLTFGEGLGRYILLGIGLALVALAGVAYAVFALGRKLPVRKFMNTAVALVMATSVAFLGQRPQHASIGRRADLPAHDVPAAADLPGRGNGHLADGAVAARPGRARRWSTSVGASYVYVVKPLPRPTTRPDQCALPPSDCGCRMLSVGVDVGGTFTKAVAVDLTTLEIVASSVVPTTHGADGGVAAGVVRAVAQLAAEVGAERIELVTHSTTQAVNALLEGDAGLVGVIGMGRRPDLARVEKRTRLNDVELAPGKRLRVRYHFFDVTDGLPREAIRDVLDELSLGRGFRSVRRRGVLPRRHHQRDRRSPRWHATPAYRCARRPT